MTDIVKKLKEEVQLREIEPKICTLCENMTVDSMSKCVDCAALMCSTCTKSHKKIKETSHHRITTARESSRPKTFIAQSSCIFHNSEVVIMYCKTCDQLICQDCILGDHKTHDCNKTSDIVKVKEESLSKTLEKFKEERIPLIKTGLEKIKKLKGENATDREKTRNGIKERLDDLVSGLQKVADRLTAENDTITQKNDEYLDQTETEFTDALQYLENLCEDFKEVMQTGSDLEKIAAELEAAIRLDLVKTADYDVHISIPKFYKSEIDKSNLQSAFGFVDTGIEESSEDYDEAKKRKDAALQKNTSCTVNDVGVKIISEFNHKSKNVFSMCPISNDSVLLHCEGDYENAAVSLDGTVEQTMTLDFIANDFVINSDTIFMVSDGKIYLMTLDGEKKGEISTSPLIPICLCLAHDGDILVTMADELSFKISYKSRRLVRKMTTSGDKVKTYEYDGLSRLFMCPTGIDENTNGDICVTDSTSKTEGQLLILEHGGGLKTTYRGEVDGQKFKPLRVKCDTKGNIIISDSYKLIHLLNSNGKLVRHLMTRNELTFVPYSLAIDAKKRLWIGCYDGQVYVIQYIK